MDIIFNDSNFGQNVRSLRKKRRMSQKTLAAEIGISVYSLRNLESGTVTPVLSADTLRRLCAALQTSTETLVHGKM